MYIRHHTVSPASPKVTMTQDVVTRAVVDPFIWLETKDQDIRL
jgi:hypothetical protein